MSVPFRQSSPTSSVSDSSLIRVQYSESGLLAPLQISVPLVSARAQLPQRNRSGVTMPTLPICSVEQRSVQVGSS